MENAQITANSANPANGSSKMTPKERLFAHFYTLTLNLRETAERTGLDINSCRYMLKQTHINDYITSVLQQNCMTSLHVEANISKIADGSDEDFYDISEGGLPMLNLNKAKARGVLGNIEEIIFDSDGRPKVKRYSKLKALELLAKRFGLVQGDGAGAKVEVNVNVQAVRETMAAAMRNPGQLEAMIGLAETLRLPAAADATGAG